MEAMRRVSVSLEGTMSGDELVASAPRVTRGLLESSLLGPGAGPDPCVEASRPRRSPPRRLPGEARSGNSEIKELNHLPLGLTRDEHVGGFDVAVNDSSAVDKLQPFGDVRDDAAHL